MRCRRRDVWQAYYYTRCIILAYTKHQRSKTKQAEESMKSKEKRDHLFCRLTKNGENQTNQAEARKRLQVRAADNEAQTHFQRPFVGQATFFWPDACTPFSSTEYRKILTTD